MAKQLHWFSLSFALSTSSVVLGTWVDTIEKNMTVAEILKKI